MSGIEIISTGRKLPGKCVTNDDLKAFVDTDDVWITSRTGIKTRFYADGEKTYELARDAALEAISRSGLEPEDISLCIVATITGDYATPSVACMLQSELGLRTDIPAFDVNAACSGFIYALNIAEKMLSEGEYALLIGVERLSKILDFTDRSTCVLFGDGAGAMIACGNMQHRFYGSMGAEGNKPALYVGGINEDASYVHMNGQEVFKFATRAIESGIRKMLSESGLSMDDIAYIVCHQANARIIAHVQRRLKIPPEKMFMNLQKYGNTSGASIPIAFDEMNKAGMLKKGEKIIAVGFGAGLTWANCLIEV